MQERITTTGEIINNIGAISNRHLWPPYCGWIVVLEVPQISGLTVSVKSIDPIDLADEEIELGDDNCIGDNQVSVVVQLAAHLPSVPADKYLCCVGRSVSLSTEHNSVALAKLAVAAIRQEYDKRLGELNRDKSRQNKPARIFNPFDDN